MVLVGFWLADGDVAGRIVLGGKNEESGHGGDVDVDPIGGVDDVCGVFELRIRHS